MDFKLFEKTYGKFWEVFPFHESCVECEVEIHCIKDCPNHQEKIRWHRFPLWEFFLCYDNIFIGFKINEEIRSQQFVVSSIIVWNVLIHSAVMFLYFHIGEISVSIHHSFADPWDSYKFEPVPEIFQNFVEVLFVSLVLQRDIIIIIEVFGKFFKFLFETHILLDFIIFL